MGPPAPSGSAVPGAPRIPHGSPMSRAERLRRLAPLLAFGFRLAVGVGALLLAVGIFRWLEASRPEPDRLDPEELRTRVEVFPARPLPVRRSWTGYGTARAMNVADVPARVASTVIAIPERIEEGVGLAAGEVIARLDPADFEARLAAAEQAVADLDAQLDRLEVDERRLRDRLELVDERVEVAEAELRRVEEAAAAGVAREREVDAARAALSTVRSERSTLLGQLDALPSSRASLRARRAAAVSDRRVAATDLERTVIRNPLGDPDAPGAADARRWRLQSLDVEIGESVQPGQRIARVLDPGRIEVPVRVPAAARRSLRVGDPVELVGASDVEELGERAVIRSTVARISPEDDPATRTTTVYVELRQAPGDAAAVAPGRFLRATVSDGDAGDRILVPRRSLDGDRLWIVGDDGRLRGLAVEPWYDVRGAYPSTGLPDRDWVVLRDPPPAGTPVVLRPGRRVADGLAVTPVPVEETVAAETPFREPGGDGATGRGGAGTEGAAGAADAAGGGAGS